MAHEAFTQFARDLLHEADLLLGDDVPDQEYIDNLADEIEAYIGIQIIEGLSDEATTEYMQLMTDGKAEDQGVIIDFFKKYIPDMDARRKEILAQFRDDFLQRNQVLADKLSE